MRRGLDLVMLSLSAILLGALSWTVVGGLSPATATPVPTETPHRYTPSDKHPATHNNPNACPHDEASPNLDQHAGVPIAR